MRGRSNQDKMRFMRTLFLLTLASALPLYAFDSPPPIPSGDVEYQDVSYDSNAYLYDDGAYATTYDPAAAAAPIQPVPTYSKNGYVKLNLYQSQYQVRGMGVTDGMSKYGYSSLSASYTFPNRNLFNLGLEHRIFGEVGFVWDHSCPLGRTPVVHLGYGIAKELIPNLKLELAYNFRHGSLEGYMARFYDGSSHRFTQDLTLSLTYNDFQRGFFGHALAGLSFQGLNGSFYDLEAGYRFTDIVNTGSFGLDLELSAGMAMSLSYWGSGVEGIDAYRVRATLLPFSHGGRIGRDGTFSFNPWVQLSWSGDNAGKIDRITHTGPVDHMQLCIGIDCCVSF